jgi:hypothetical protein
MYAKQNSLLLISLMLGADLPHAFAVRNDPEPISITVNDDPTPEPEALSLSRLEKREQMVTESPSDSTPLFSTWGCQNHANSSFLSFRYDAPRGIGYREAYVSGDLFLSTTTSSFFTPFLDLRGHRFMDGRYASNSGFGMRDLNQTFETVFGINVFYDFRKAPHYHFHQIGPGLEILGTKWDFRANGYIPILKRRKAYAEKIVHIDGSAVFQKRVEFNFTGGDVELGRVIVKNKIIHLKGTGGAYYLKGLFNKKAIGGFLRLSGHLTPLITFSAQGSYDTHFKWIAQGEVGFVIPFGGRLFDLKHSKCPNGRYHAEERLLENVSRFEIIPVASHKRKQKI